MKKNYLVALLFLAGALCGSCSDDDDLGNGNGDAVLDKGTKNEQVVYADDETIKDKGIKFSTQGAWKAEVVELSTRSVETSGQTVDWLTLSQYSGDKAGDYTITLTLKQNFTGKSRKAEIRILCGQTVITISVEQKAEKEDGIKLKRVKSVDYTLLLGTEANKQHEYYEDDNCTFTYSYDQEGRVAKVVQSWYDEESTYLFDYHIVGEITVNESNDNFDPSLPDDYKCEHLLTLNKQGNVENIRSKDGYYSAKNIKAAYYQDGRLAELSDDDSYESWNEKYFYTDGLLTKLERKVGMYDPDIYEFEIAKAYTNRYSANKANIDFNAFILEPLDDTMAQILYQIGLLGKGSDCLIETKTNDGESVNIAPENMYTEPDKVIKHTRKEIKYSKEKMFPVKYELDGDKYVTKFSYVDPYEVIEYYYEIHVGHELMDPKYPDRGYKYQIKNEKRTKLSDEKNTFTYTVTYE